MFERLLSMLKKEYIQALRDPRMRFILFVIPVFQTIVFGYAVNTDVRHIATAVYDRDNSPESRDLVQSFLNSGYFGLVEYLQDDGRVRELLDRGTVRMVLHLGKGFGAALAAGRTVPVQIILDGTDANTAGIVLGYAGAITARFNGEAVADRIVRQFGTPPRVGRVELKTRAWFNENLESRNFYVPAVIANIVFIITMILSSMAVVREKEIGTIEQIVVTPITRAEFILGKTIPFALIGFADVGIITTVATFWFDVPVRGSIPLLFAATALFLLSSLGFGLFISSISRTQQQALMSAFFFIFPAMLLSGFAFPIVNMPEPVQWLTLLNPLQYYLVIIRGIFLKGVGTEVLWPQFLGLALLGVMILTFAVRRFSKTLG
jgi:drug efflux transport system permease protein